MAETPKHILVSVLDWGLGHATRSMVVINALLLKGFHVSVAGNGQSLELLKQEYPQLSFYELQPYDVWYSRVRPFMLNILVQVPKFIKAIRIEHRQVEALIARNKFDAIISDNRYGCWSQEIPGVLVTHQLNLQMPTYVLWLSRLVNYFNHRQIKKFTTCWVPDGIDNTVAGVLTERKVLKVRYIGILSRFKSHPVDRNENLIVALVSGPEPQRSIFEELLVKEMEKQTKECIIVRGMPTGLERRHSHIKFINHSSINELSELIQKAGTLVSRSGYSTLMDLATLGIKQIVFIPTPGQTEQEYLAAQMVNRKIALMQRQSEFDLTKGLEEVKEYAGFDQINPEANLLDQAIEELRERIN